MNSNESHDMPDTAYGYHSMMNALRNQYSITPRTFRMNDTLPLQITDDLVKSIEQDLAHTGLISIGGIRRVLESLRRMVKPHHLPLQPPAPNPYATGPYQHLAKDWEDRYFVHRHEGSTVNIYHGRRGGPNRIVATLKTFTQDPEEVEKTIDDMLLLVARANNSFTHRAGVVNDDVIQYYAQKNVAVLADLMRTLGKSVLCANAACGKEIVRRGYTWVHADTGRDVCELPKARPAP